MIRVQIDAHSGFCGGVIKAINAAISDVREKNDTMLTARYTNETAKKMGRVETNKVRAKMAEEWDA